MKSPVRSAVAAVALRGTAQRRLPREEGRRHTRFVQRTKWTLPAIAAALLLLVAVWPEFGSVFQRMRLAGHIDLSDARKLRMVNPRYTGTDRQGRPYYLTAAAATQVPHSDDLVTLDAPKADLTTASGNWVEISGDAGAYQTQPQLLDLFGNVVLYQDRGNEFHTDSARIDVLHGTAQGKDAITGQGPFGHVTAQGFTIYNHGDIIVFSGKTDLTLAPHPKDAE
jgi:lipopolysaccharide export system protein LptC